MNNLILKLNGITPTATDFVNLHTSIVRDLQTMHSIIPAYGPIYLQDLVEGLGWGMEDWLVTISQFKHAIDKSLRQVISLIRNGLLNDPKYRTEVAILYKVIKGYDNQWRYVDAPPQIMSFYHVYKNVVKSYDIAFIAAAISAIKENTPIVDNNICDILSFLNDEKYFTKHQIDSVIYDMA